MPTARTGTPAVVIGDQIHVVGGGAAGGVTAVHEVYDASTDAWDSAAPDLLVRGSAAAGVIDGRLYFAGGFVNGDGNNPTAALTIYDPQTDSWSFGASMPLALGAAVSAVIGDKLYVAGGARGVQPSFDDLQIYDPDSNTWSLGAQMPTAREFAAGGVIDGKLYVVGGRFGPGNFDYSATDALEVYDPDTNTWTTRTPMPTSRIDLIAGVVDNKLYAVAGNSGPSDWAYIDAVEVYDPATDSWSAETPIPTVRAAAAGAVVDNTLYVMGGYTGGPPLEVVEAFSPRVEVTIDVKPGSDPNSVNVDSEGVIAVAVLTTADFDASRIDAASVVFAGAAAFHNGLEDVDGDGDLDMVLHFRTQETNLRQTYEQLLIDDVDEDGVLDSTRQEAEVSLTGRTLDDVLFEGLDSMDLFLTGRELRSALEDLAAAGVL